MAVEQVDQRPVKCGDAAGFEWDGLADAVAGPQHDGVRAQVERQGEAAPPGSDWRHDQPFGDRDQGDVPTMIGPRCVSDTEFAQHLAGKMQQGKGW
jgi:hypothetical protein